MAYMNCARYAQEQNLIAIQTDGRIYYEACKDISTGSELLVWYGDCYIQFMGIPVGLKDSVDSLHPDEAESRSTSVHSNIGSKNNTPIMTIANTNIDGNSKQDK